MDWFEEWFDSPYYHILYANRNEEEASTFIDHLLANLAPVQSSIFLDLACGKGRHAVHISEKGFETHGIDLSEQSIAYARQFESDLLHFHRGDMREVFRTESFDYILNLFTSFGYFSEKKDNIRVLESVFQQLKPGGTFVLDYLNAAPIIEQLPYKGTVERDEIVFNISKQFESDKIVKQIQFSHKGNDHNFHEKVQVFSVDELRSMLENTGFEIKTIWGDYRLNPYDVGQSDRIIIRALKPLNA